MATITSLGSSDSGAVSRTTINTNFTNLNSDKLETSVLDTDVALTANSDAKVATQKAVKAYVDGYSTVSTSGVSAGPASSGTQTITHGLGKTPTIIRISGYGNAEGASTHGGMSTGLFNSTGNRSVSMLAAVTTSGVGTSTSYAVRLSSSNSTGGGDVSATGIINNVTSTTFDIVWTNSGDCSTRTGFVWEAQ